MTPIHLLITCGLIALLIGVALVNLADVEDRRTIFTGMLVTVCGASLAVTAKIFELVCGCEL